MHIIVKGLLHKKVIFKTLNLSKVYRQNCEVWEDEQLQLVWIPAYWFADY